VTSWIALAFAITLVVYAVLVGALYAAGRRTQARAIGGFLPDCAILLRRLMRDPRVPRRHKAVVVAALGYVLLPLDLVPDFLPVVGQADDALVVALALRLVIAGAGAAVVTEHWPGPEQSLQVLLRLVVRPGARRPRAPHRTP
jgi:uncharacterized membrane protein YkvA (DUF1232 family)